MFYALGLPAAAMSKILNRTFYGLKDSWTPMKATLLSASSRILLSFLLLQPLAHMGLALADSIAMTMRVIFLLAVMPPALKGEEVWNTIQSFARTLMICVLMGGMLYTVRGNIAGASVPLELLSLALFGAVIYTVLTFVFHKEEVQTLLRVFTAFRRKAPVSAG
jgi:putative peptidoglycan lipid II flippase